MVLYDCDLQWEAKLNFMSRAADICVLSEEHPKRFGELVIPIEDSDSTTLCVSVAQITTK